jgi:hypothetical protein
MGYDLFKKRGRIPREEKISCKRTFSDDKSISTKVHIKMTSFRYVHDEDTAKRNGEGTEISWRQTLMSAASVV